MSPTQNLKKNNHSFAQVRKHTEEYKRLQQTREQQMSWKKWGPYLSDRQWATVREHYGEEDHAWSYFSYDEARNRAYRWGEDGIFGISDDQQRLCFALTLWNGKDDHFKERFFGLPGMWGENTGNHMEDVKEYYFYLDNTPTHSYMKALYKYPYEFPYETLKKENNKRGKDKPEYELIDTGCFEKGYFDIMIEYAKKTPEDILIKITVWNQQNNDWNQGNDEPHLHLFPTLWFRNTWSWGKPNEEKPSLTLVDNINNSGLIVVKADYYNKSGESQSMYLYCEQPQDYLFTENETGKKNGIEQYIINQGVEPSRQQGTKFSAHYFEGFDFKQLNQNSPQVIYLRLTTDSHNIDPFGNEFEEIFRERTTEANEFYQAITPLKFPISEEMRQIQRQAFAGMLWNKQFYYYVVQDWLEGDFLYHWNQAKVYPNHEIDEKRKTMNGEWTHLHNEDIISMPDKWEYPYYCVWDSAFHAVTFTLIDPDFAKEQLCLFTESQYMSSKGQIPSCEFDFNQIHPPVLAWAALQVYEIEQDMYGLPPDKKFLERIFAQLVKNFNWWLKFNRIDDKNYLFSGGFLGLDNISIIDRNQFLKDKNRTVTIEQADATGWAGLFCLNMLRIVIELGKNTNQGEERRNAVKELGQYFLETFINISHEINEIYYEKDDKKRISFWDSNNDFYYEVLKISLEGKGFALELPLKYRSLLGIIPVFSVDLFTQKEGDYVTPYLKNEFYQTNSCFAKFNNEDYNYLFGKEECVDIPKITNNDHPNDRELFLSIVNKKHLLGIMDKLLDEKEFLSKYGIRSLSKFHEEHPFQLDGLLRNMYGQCLPIEIKYEPGESVAPIHTGNSNWRGPIWFPMNFLLIESLKKYHDYFNVCLQEEDFKVLFPAISHHKITLKEVAFQLSERLINIFLSDSQKNNQRPVYGDNAKIYHLFKDPETDQQNLILFYEYFNGDTGQGLGASHQTGWTGLVANLIYQVGEYQYK